VFIEPGALWQNPYAESFNGRFRDEFLSCGLFTSPLEARILAEDWRVEYNTLRPHSALGMMPPADFAASWRRSLQPHPGLSQGVGA